MHIQVQWLHITIWWYTYIGSHVFTLSGQGCLMPAISYFFVLQKWNSATHKHTHFTGSYLEENWNAQPPKQAAFKSEQYRRRNPLSMMAVLKGQTVHCSHFSISRGTLYLPRQVSSWRGVSNRCEVHFSCACTTLPSVHFDPYVAYSRGKQAAQGHWDGALLGCNGDKDCFSYYSRRRRKTCDWEG